jgi:hypothetical protein
MHKLVSVLANARVAKQTLAWGTGEEPDKPVLSMETAFLRQMLSTAIVPCFGHRLASRMSQVGRGASLSFNRRQEWSREEKRARAVRNAAWLASVTGQDIVKRGRFWTA